MVNAYYGTSSRQCDATMAVRRLLRQNGDGRSVEFKVSNNLCGDPAHGKSKTLTVEYACGNPRYCDDKPRIATADEFHTLSMSCQSINR